MKDPKLVNIAGQGFSLYPIPPRRAGELERKLLKVILPAMVGGLGNLLRGADFSGLDGKNDTETGKALISRLLGSSVDLAVVTNSVMDSLGALSDIEFNALLVGMFERVQWIRVNGDGSQTPTFLTSGELIDSAFEDTLSMYKLMYEVARYNKFLPFGMAGTGTPT